MADGSLTATYEGVLVDVIGAPSDMPRPVLDELEHRTPSFEGWQQGRWLFHCSDGMAYLGVATPSVLDDDAIRDSMLAAVAEFGIDRATLLSALDAGRMSSLLVHVFRCLHCGDHAAYGDPD